MTQEKKSLVLYHEVKVYSYSEDNALFDIVEKVYVDEESFTVMNARYKGKTPILMFGDISDRNAAEKLIGKDIYIDKEHLPKLPQGGFYVRDIIGFQVLWEGKSIGILKDVKTDTSQDLYVVQGENKEILIPGVKEFILRIDPDNKEIRVKLPEGLLDI